MGKVHLINTNFTGGELDPRLKGGVDIPRYQKAADTLQNAIVLITGGAQRRPGTKHVDDEGAGVSVRQVPFIIFRTDVTPPVLQGYNIEFRDDDTIHFYTEGAQITSGGGAYSIASPYVGVDLRKIRYEQFNNVLYLVHPDVPPQQLTRTTDTNWTIAAVSFPMPTAQAVKSITRVDDTATVTMMAKHDYAGGHIVTIGGSYQGEYNGDHEITVIDNKTFTFTVTGSPATPATGTITATRKLFTLPWDASSGYPQAIAFFEQRMFLAGNKANPTMIWGSESGNITNLVSNTGDSDPFEAVVSAATSSIVHLTAQKYLHVATADRGFIVSGGTDKPITPSNIDIKEHTRYGCAETVRPIVIGTELLFLTRHAKQLRAAIFDFASDTYKAPDISVVSAHLLKAGIVAMAHQPEPVSIIWMVTSDGKLISGTYDREQEVVAYAPHTTDGLFKDVIVIPSSGTDEVWVVVERTVGGVAHTFVEVFDPTLYTDSAYTGTDVAGKTVWTGLVHLEGKLVDIKGDGVVMPQQTVTGGQVTLPRAAKVVEIGLHFSTIIKTLPPEIPTTIGTAQGQAVSVNKVTVRLYESIGCTINGEVVPFRKFGAGVLDTDVPLFTGDKVAQVLGWEEQGTVTIEQNQPLPLTVLAVIKEVTING